jgi:hypothetical protein
MIRDCPDVAVEVTLPNRPVMSIRRGTAAGSNANPIMVLDPGGWRAIWIAGRDWPEAVPLR